MSNSYKLYAEFSPIQQLALIKEDNNGTEYKLKTLGSPIRGQSDIVRNLSIESGLQDNNLINMTENLINSNEQLNKILNEKTKEAEGWREKYSELFDRKYENFFEKIDDDDIIKEKIILLESQLAKNKSILEDDQIKIEGLEKVLDYKNNELDRLMEQIELKNEENYGLKELLNENENKRIEIEENLHKMEENLHKMEEKLDIILKENEKLNNILEEKLEHSTDEAEKSRLLKIINEKEEEIFHLLQEKIELKERTSEESDILKEKIDNILKDQEEMINKYSGIINEKIIIISKLQEKNRADFDCLKDMERKIIILLEENEKLNKLVEEKKVNMTSIQQLNSEILRQKIEIENLESDLNLNKGFLNEKEYEINNLNDKIDNLLNKEQNFKNESDGYKSIIKEKINNIEYLTEKYNLLEKENEENNEKMEILIQANEKLNRLVDDNMKEKGILTNELNNKNLELFNKNNDFTELIHNVDRQNVVLLKKTEEIDELNHQIKSINLKQKTLESEIEHFIQIIDIHKQSKEFENDKKNSLIYDYEQELIHKDKYIDDLKLENEQLKENFDKLLNNYDNLKEKIGIYIENKKGGKMSNSTFKSPKKIMNKVKIENNIDFKDLGGFMKKIKMEIYELETNNNNLEQFKENLDDIIINNDTLLNWKEKIQNNNLVINQKIEFVGKEIKNIFEQIDENKIDYSKFNKD